MKLVKPYSEAVIVLTSCFSPLCIPTRQKSSSHAANGRLDSFIMLLIVSLIEISFLYRIVDRTYVQVCKQNGIMWGTYNRR